MHIRQADLIGKKFGRLTLLEIKENGWLCRCDCGIEKIIKRTNIIKGATQSCGCLHKERFGALNRTHGASGTLTWKRWRSMVARCTMKNAKSYPRYGGRGIIVCERWLTSFENFLSDMGECPDDNFTLERKNNDGNYELTNCRWATRKEQNRNSSRNHILVFKDESHCITEWADILGINFRTIMTRINKGWSAEQALGTPIKTQKQRVKK